MGVSAHLLQTLVLAKKQCDLTFHEATSELSKEPH